MTTTMRITFDDCYSTEHNTLMKAMVSRLNGVEIVSGEGDTYTVNADEVAVPILKHLSDCDMILVEEA